MELYFVGGEDLKTRDSKRINKQAFKAAGTPKILIVPWTVEPIEEPNKYWKIMEDYFTDLGAKEINFAKIGDSTKELARKVGRCNLIYLPGGDPRVLLKNLKAKGMDKLIKNFEGIFIGNSAGALVMCDKYAVVKRQDDYPKTTFYKGLGLVNFSVSVHYKSKVPHLAGESADEELQNLSKNRKIYAIPERCALIYKNKKITFIGKVKEFKSLK